MSLNKVTLIGRLGKDPDVQNTRDGKVYAKFSVATSERWKDKSGQKQEKTEWHNCVIWNENLAGIAENYLRKGSQVYLEGRMQTRKWEKDGQDHYTTDVILQGFDCKLVLLGGKNDSGGGREDSGDDGFSRGAPKSNSRSSASSGSRPGRQSDMDDDIPFAAEFR